MSTGPNKMRQPHRFPANSPRMPLSPQLQPMARYLPVGQQQTEVVLTAAQMEGWAEERLHGLKGVTAEAALLERVGTSPAARDEQVGVSTAAQTEEWAEERLHGPKGMMVVVELLERVGTSPAARDELIGAHYQDGKMCRCGDSERHTRMDNGWSVRRSKQERHVHWQGMGMERGVCQHTMCVM
ncbi:hypothetical protein DUNSADRAFT_604 [Dunaliella salina]|uniref:Encoded protein n=1 Tax=Dunaliella salina TaxID=3046 RepID=A0ABQ7FYP0_DUNSA|nr:hypothetical protein DUNSADRAFT_604 [Dunaliella salina]|eukprot:KAF5827477.1 hypothetical protein DUNSADRAFT_604 [Dunaliella salina]